MPTKDNGGVRPSLVAVARLAVPTAGCVVAWVTMVTVPVESDIVRFGFPLPAFGHSVNSGSRTLLLGPLLIDLVVALAVVWPLSAWLVRRIGTRAAMIVGLVPILAMLGVAADLGFRAYFGSVNLRSWSDPYTEAPVLCRALWMGPPARRIEGDDGVAACARQAPANDVRD